MKVQYSRTTGITSGEVIFNIKIILSKTEAREITADELRELAHSKLDRAIGNDDE